MIIFYTTFIYYKKKIKKNEFFLVSENSLKLSIPRAKKKNIYFFS